MIWMDSYYRIHALSYSWVRSDVDMADWVADAVLPLKYAPPEGDAHNVMPAVWALSAYAVITNMPIPDGVGCYNYVLSLGRIRKRMHMIIEDMAYLSDFRDEARRRMSIIGHKKEADDYDTDNNAGPN